MDIFSLTNSNINLNSNHVKNNKNSKNNNEIKNGNNVFVNDDKLYDLIQSKDLLNNKQSLINDNINHINKTNNKFHKSIKDNIDNENCINNNCRKFERKEYLKNDLGIPNNIHNKDLIDKEADDTNKSIYDKGFKNLMNFFYMFINFIYIFALSVLLINSVINKSTTSLIYIITITLIYILYKILIKYY